MPNYSERGYVLKWNKFNLKYYKKKFKFKKKLFPNVDFHVVF